MMQNTDSHIQILVHTTIVTWYLTMMLKTYTLEKTVPLEDGSGKFGFCHAEKLRESLSSHTAQNSTTKE